MTEVFLGIGANKGDRFENIQKCLKNIKSNSSINYISSSKIYESAPMYNVNQNFFLNLVIKIETIFKPLDLLKEIKKIESDMGRKFTELNNQPRIIDIDILSYTDIIFNNNKLVIPHPKIIERSFVLKPWSDIDPNYKLPKINKTISELISNLDINSNIIKLYDKSL